MERYDVMGEMVLLQKEGDWVKYEDIEKLKIENTQLKKFINSPIRYQCSLCGKRANIHVLECEGE